MSESNDVFNASLESGLEGTDPTRENATVSHAINMTDIRIRILRRVSIHLVLAIDSSDLLPVLASDE
jgi:hypothetical protein